MIMRRWIAGAFAAGLALAGGYAAAQIVPALPFQLQNNTVADATQVMANFNQLLNNINANGAKNGANSDITSLLGLTTPLAPSVGGTSTWTGGTSGGSANAQTVTPVVPSTFSLVAGSRVVFKAGFTNTAAMTLAVAGGAAKNVFRLTQIGAVATAGGEVVSGAMVDVIYDGTQYQIVAPPVLVGEIKDYTGGSATPPGHTFADGSCHLQTEFPALFVVIGTSWGSCPAGQFAMPDARARATISIDGGANRVTSATGCNAILTAGCGSQNQTLSQANLPSVNFALSITDSRTWATSNALLPAGGATAPGAGGITGAATATQPVVVTGGSIGGTAASGGSGTALTTLQPLLVVHKVIKY